MFDSAGDLFQNDEVSVFDNDICQKEAFIFQCEIDFIPFSDDAVIHQMSKDRIQFFLVVRGVALRLFLKCL